MSSFRIEAEPLVDADIESAFDWFESEQLGLGLEFLEEVREAYLRIRDNPFKYADLRSGIRRSLTKRFPYAVYFAVEKELIVVLAVLHTARDPAAWQFRL